MNSGRFDHCVLTGWEIKRGICIFLGGLGKGLGLGVVVAGSDHVFGFGVSIVWFWFLLTFK